MFELFYLHLWSKFEENRSSRLREITKWNIWPLTLTFDLVVTIINYNISSYFCYLHLGSKFEENRSNRLWEITKWNIWPLILTFDLEVTIIKYKISSYFFICIYGPNLKKIDQTVSEKTQNELFDLWPWPLTLRSQS